MDEIKNECLLFKAKWSIFQLLKQITFDKMMMLSGLY